jgi:inosine-uridine nucleoside N-ribohydrolase
LNAHPQLSDISTRHPHFEALKADTEDQFKYLIAKDDNGPQAILDILNSRPPRTVTFCALGPLTTLALTRRLSEASGTHFDQLIGRVLIMGGCVRA